MKARLTPSFELTTEHPASQYGIPVLLNHHGEAFGASDILNLYPSVGHCSAAAFVVRYAEQFGAAEREAAETILPSVARRPATVTAGGRCFPVRWGSKRIRAAASHDRPVYFWVAEASWPPPESRNLIVSTSDTHDRT